MPTIPDKTQFKVPAELEACHVDSRHFPGGGTLWSMSKVYSHVYIHSLPDLEEIGQMFVGQVPKRVTMVRMAVDG